MPQLERSHRDYVQPPEWARFALYERKAIGADGLGLLQRWDRDAADWIAGQQQITITDPYELFEGWTGDLCLCQYRLDTQAWELVAPTQRVVRFELTATLSTGSSAVAKVRNWSGSAWVTSNYTLTVWDADSLFTGVNGDKGRAEYHYDSGRWEIYQKNC